MTERAVARMFCMNARYTNQNVLILPPARSLPAHLLNVLYLKKKKARKEPAQGVQSEGNRSIIYRLSARTPKIQRTRFTAIGKQYRALTGLCPNKSQM